VEQRREILARVARRLKPGGFLFLGATESTLGVSEAFERYSGKFAGAYRLKPGGSRHAD
jgi:chemotaxis protein methyltransferase CheR